MNIYDTISLNLLTIVYETKLMIKDTCGNLIAY